MVVRMRHTRAHTRNRRSHHGLEGARLRVCVHCKAKHVSHTVCLSCGTYRGRAVVDVAKKALKKEKKAKVREKQGA